MGILDFFRGGDEPTPSQIQKAIKQVTQPHGEQSVRLSAFDRLQDWGTEEAMGALLRRFTIQTPSGQMDLDECQEVERMLAEAGEVATKPILAFIARESNVAYPARALEKILPAEQFATEILGALERLDGGFGSNEQQRSGLIRALDDIDDPRVPLGLVPFLTDHSDDVAIVALRGIAKYDDDDNREALIDAFLAFDDRPRMREAIAETLAELGWQMHDRRKQVDACLPADFALDKKGRVVRVR
jgi:HEAT repeat protein